MSGQALAQGLRHHLGGSSAAWSAHIWCWSAGFSVRCLGVMQVDPSTLVPTTYMRDLDRLAEFGLVQSWLLQLSFGELNQWMRDLSL